MGDQAVTLVDQGVPLPGYLAPISGEFQGLAACGFEFAVKAFEVVFERIPLGGQGIALDFERRQFLFQGPKRVRMTGESSGDSGQDGQDLRIANEPFFDRSTFATVALR
jgi:hypothetical protein